MTHRAVDKFNHVTSMALALFIITFHLNTFTFEIDELIITENINKNFAEYFSTNSAYFPFLKVSHWISENYLGGGPLAWRILSSLSFILLIGFLFQFLKSKSLSILSPSIVITLASLHFPIQYARWGMSSYALSSFILFVSFIILFPKNDHKQSHLSLFTYTTLASIALAIVYVGELLSLLSLFIAILLFNIIERKPLYPPILSCITVTATILISTFLYSHSGQGLSPRTSIKQYYFPLAEQENIFLFAIKGITNTIIQSTSLLSGVSNTSTYSIIFLIIISCLFHGVFYTKNTTRLSLIITTWILIIFIIHLTLSSIGKAPFGNIRYNKSLIWSLPLLGHCILSLFFNFITNRLEFTQTLKSKFFRTACTAILTTTILTTSTFLLFDIINNRRNEAKGFLLLQSAMKKDADLYLVDELHKFSFTYLNPVKTYHVMSRFYPCDNGRFWNAYGWNDCSEMKVNVSNSFASAIVDPKVETISVISRGPFTRQSYPYWHKFLLKKKGFFISNVTNYKGPYISILKRTPSTN